MAWGGYEWKIEPRTGETLLDHLLSCRGIDQSDRPHFLQPNFDDQLHDPFLLEGMAAAVERLVCARDQGQTVGIFGDYDADGIPGTVLLVEQLKRFGLKVVSYIPARTDGFGLSKAGIDQLKNAGASLLISVDCGVTAKAEADYAKSLGLDVIITDHHEPQAALLPTDIIAVIDPKLSPNYPFQGLSGTAVAWKLLQALHQKTGHPTLADLKWGLDLVGISTICDLMPLVDESRVFAHFGLLVLRRGRRLGLRTILDEAGLQADSLSYSNIGMSVGPWLNAVGRMSDPNQAVELLLSQKPHEARTLTAELAQATKDRNQALQQAWPEAVNQAASQGQDQLIVVAADTWPAGVAGLIAGRLSREYNRPVIALSRDGDSWRGSGRAGDGQPILPLLEASSSDLLGFGGHLAAAGLEIAADHFEQAIASLKQAAANSAVSSRLAELAIDAELELPEISFQTLEELRQLEPFGVGNSVPRFCLRGVRLDTFRSVGKTGNHLQLRLSAANLNRSLRAVAWQTKPPEWLKPRVSLEVAFRLEPDTYTGPQAVQLVVEDAKLSQ